MDNKSNPPHLDKNSIVGSRVMYTRPVFIALIMGTTALTVPFASAQQVSNSLNFEPLSPICVDDAHPALSCIVQAKHIENAPISSGYGQEDFRSFEILPHAAPESAPALRTEDILMSYDSLSATPHLNAGLVDGSGVARAGEVLSFVTYWNYDHWIEKAEILIFDEESTSPAIPITSIDVGVDGQAQWLVPVGASRSYSYVLRVYDSNNRFDDTHRKSIALTEEGSPNHTPLSSTPIYGEDNTDRRNIRINGGTITVSGNVSDVSNVQDITVFGRYVPIDGKGQFAVQQIMPSGTHSVGLSYLKADGRKVLLNRGVHIPENDFFLVGLGDLTVGQRGSGARALVEAGGEDFDPTFVTGRAAFYLKGKVQGKYLITASLDTTEDDISNIFSNLNDRDPQSLLRRLDPDQFYPVYGDDSTFTEDAPTQGRFYVRVEHGDDHVVWGNFLTNITSTEFSQIDRGLYGAKLEYNNDATTDHGERRSRLTLFAADPGTVPGRDEFLGTGGSVFFLERQDLTIGSERVRIEVRDKDSGLVLETRDLRPFVDYDVDYIQGRIVLSEPLSSTVLNDQIVRDGNLSGNNAFLVVRYEFTPGLADIGGFTTGGRGEAWLNNHIRVGLSGQQEETGDANQTLLATDLLVRATDSTYFKAEFANTDGQAFGESQSLDGGFSFNDLQSADLTPDANAFRFEAAVGLQDISSRNGQLVGYYENIEAGFSGPGRLAITDTERFGASATLALPKLGNGQISIKYDQINLDGGLEETTIATDLRFGLSERLSAGLGVRYNNIEGSAAGRNGGRADIGGQLEYVVTKSVTTYVFGQGSVSQTGTIGSAERYGIGGRARLFDNVQVNGEVSTGAGGIGALGGATFQRRDGEEYYLNYTLDGERSQSGLSGANSLINSQSTLTLGGRKRFNSFVSVFGEERRSFGNASGLTHAYGIDFNVTERWTLGGNFEVGEVENLTQIIDREAFTVTSGYAGEGITAGVAFEWREDDQNGQRRESWFLRSNASLQVSPDWRALLRFDRAESNSSEGSFFEGGFTEIQVAGAYRPVRNDRLNGLVRYFYYEDLAAPEQISNSGQSGLPAQRSNILSVDGQYRLSKWLTIGAKYGLRAGEMSLSRLSSDFIDSSAQLGVLRLDLHVIKKWDAVIEGRVLAVSAANDQKAGFLAAAYRHIGENVKFGIGYNFTDFSTDLTDQTFDDNGVFINLVSKF